jgi:hypothetical protein
MNQLTIEVPEVVARRLEALSAISGKSVDELAREGVDAFAGSRASRRTILKARRTAAKASGTEYSLADLGWLDGYTGQTVDELLLFEGTDEVHSILFALEQAIEEKIKAAGPLKMTGVELIVLSVLGLDREVNNGGYRQFFTNSSRRFAPVIVNHLVVMGCTDLAEITQDALDALGLSKPSVAAIEAAMESESEKRDRILNRCDVRFYEKPRPYGRCFPMSKRTRRGFRFSGQIGISEGAGRQVSLPGEVPP